jgi:DNA-nicking Smr family endonuclease
MSKKGRFISGEEKSLWQRFVQDINPWHDDGTKIEAISVTKKQGDKTLSKHEKHHTQNLSGNSPESAGPQTLDRKTDIKLSKGKMPIEATLDLHGMTQREAHERLDHFIMRSFSDGKRCVLVITGKGSRDVTDGHFISERREKGVLKSRLPEWLAMSPLHNIVLKHIPAHQKHGGSGAFYIYLKNNRK